MHNECSFTKTHFSLCYSPQTNAKPLGGTDALPIICIHLGDGRPNKCQHSFKLLPVESGINLKAILVQAELLTQPVVFPVLPPATINAVDPHSPPGNHDRRRGIVRCHGKKRYYSRIHFANCRSKFNQDVQVSDAI